MQITIGELTLEWAVPPGTWSYDGEALNVTAAADTDIFRAPDGTAARNSAARALAAAPEGDWQFSARVSVGFRNWWDAGTLLVWADEQHWGKLCFELSPQRVPFVMSVVTRGRSDDAVGWAPEGDRLWLRISRRSGAFYFHVSADGRQWRLARQFALDDALPIGVGVGTQSPAGDGCSATFDRITFTRTRLADPFDGC